MANRYQIWNKTDSVITPIGEVLTPEQWIERYPAARIITWVIAKGEINGAFSSSLAQMVQVYSAQGCDFSQCVTDEDKLDVIEAWEDAQKEAQEELANIPTVEERTASALEFLAINSLPDSE